MSEPKNAFWNNWTWIHWIVFVVVLSISVKEVYSRQAIRLGRLNKQSVDVIEVDIQEYNTMAERLAQLEVLPPVKKQWDFVPAIAAKYGVRVNVIGSNRNLKKEQSGRMYDGPLAAWNAELSGSLVSVLVAAQEIQRAVPAYLYQFSIKKGESTIGLSILGSE